MKTHQQVQNNDLPYATANSQSSLFFQPKLKVNAPNDVYEQEADAMADQVMRMPEMEEETVQTKATTDIQRACAACEQQEDRIQRHAFPEEDVQTKSSRKTGDGGFEASPQFGSELQRSKGGGESLSNTTLGFMNRAFNYDFSGVRIHHNSQAANLSQQIQAKAFTTGSDIYFNKGQYNPNASEGKRLLAHELTHVIQQSRQTSLQRSIQRNCNTNEYDRITQQTRNLALYQNIPRHRGRDVIYQPREARRVADRLMREARNRPNCLYYANRLHTLFSTPEQTASSISATFGPQVAAAAQAEAIRLATPAGRRNRQFEETLSGAAGRRWQRRRGFNQKIYYVDATDPANIVIKLKVRLQGAAVPRRQVQSYEDAIEKRASVLGYTIDLQFVRNRGRDVFEVFVNPSSWPTSGNWVGGPRTLAHELHHLLGLDDRYNYIDSHHNNAQMLIVNRLHWFSVQFARPDDPLIRVSFMGAGGLITDEDICLAIQAPDMGACLRSRQALRAPGLRAKSAAAYRCLRIREILRGIAPIPMAGPGGGRVNRTLTQRAIRSAARTVFGRAVSDADILHNIMTMERYIRLSHVQMMGQNALNCDFPVMARNHPLAFLFCPAFTTLNATQKIQEVLTASYRMYQFLGVRNRASRALGGTTNTNLPGQWARFVIMAYSRI